MVGQGILKDKYPRMFANSCQKEAKVSMVGEWIENSWKWKFDWRRNWFEWAKPMLKEFIQDLESYMLNKDTKDK